jgi:hypothetical protein
MLIHNDIINMLRLLEAGNMHKVFWQICSIDSSISKYFSRYKCSGSWKQAFGRERKKLTGNLKHAPVSADAYKKALDYYQKGSADAGIYASSYY